MTCTIAPADETLPESAGGAQRALDREGKRSRMLALLDRHAAPGLVLESAGALSWYLDGARVSVSAAGDPIAAMLVTREGDLVVTGTNEAPRLRAEELPDDVAIREVGWWETPEAAASALAPRGALREVDVAAELRAARASLLPGELARYESLCRDVAESLTDALQAATPRESERALAARAAAAVVARGAEPLVILACGAERVGHRHPLPTAGPLGRRAMLVVCARRHGLIANATRWVRFGAARAEEIDAEDRLLEVEADVFDASMPGRTVAEVFADLRAAYPAHGFDHDEWRNHHQGGPCGYVGRDPRATGDVADVLVEGQAVAWNPSAPGVKVEDTVLLSASGHRALTLDPRWPTRLVRGRARPREWESA